MNGLTPFDISKATEIRYSKIQNIINILKGDVYGAAGNAVYNDFISSVDIHAFNLGKSISIDGQTIKIGKKSYQSYEIQKVTVNTEGSMSIYDRSGKKICGFLRLNVSLENIDLFCVWVRKYNIAVEIKSGKTERIFQYAILAITVLLIILYKILRIVL